MRRVLYMRARVYVYVRTYVRKCVYVYYIISTPIILLQRADLAKCCFVVEVSEQHLSTKIQNVRLL